MTIEQINKIFNDTAYVRMGGSEDELKCAEYIKKLCKEMNLGDAYIEPFEVDMATIKSATLTVRAQCIRTGAYRVCSR